MTSKTDLLIDKIPSYPDLHPSCFVAPGAKLIGNVRLSQDSSVWYNAVLRGDINAISIGPNTNIQDGCMVHLENDLGCIVGESVTVGHHAILHGCTIEDAVLIGMGAIILNGAHISKGSIIAAGAVIKENTQVPPFTLMAGVPAKPIKELPKNTLDDHIAWAAKYVHLAHIHKQQLAQEPEILMAP